MRSLPIASRPRSERGVAKPSLTIPGGQWTVTVRLILRVAAAVRR